MLGELGVSAKTNLVKVKCLFDQIDKDGSGDIDGDELTCAHPSCDLSRRSVLHGTSQC